MEKLLFAAMRLKLRKKKEEKHLAQFAISWFGYFVPLQYFLALLEVLLVMKLSKMNGTLLKRLISLPFFRFFCIVIYCVSALSLHIELVI